jgi:Acetyltransferase (GNAT) domain
MKMSICSQPPERWQAMCARYDSLFASTEWQELLHHAFNIRSFYVLAEEEEWSFALQVFRAGPFRAGYINFPLGGTLGGHLPHPSCITSLGQHLSSGVQLMNLICPAFIQEEATYTGTPVMLPETAITDLANYRLLDKKKLRRDVKRARQFGTRISENPGLNNAQALYTLYKDTIARHQGKIRYNVQYFQELIRLSHQSNSVHILTASLDLQMIGFLVLVRHNNWAYYLHGATDRAYAKYGVSDLLIASAIELAQTQGLAAFNMMASPAEQLSLVKYKEKWGATTRQQKHFQYFSHPGWKFAYHLGNSAHSLLDHGLQLCRRD